MDINIDPLYNILKQNQGDVNDAMGSKKKTVVVTSDPLALIAEKTNVRRSKEKVVVSSDSEGSEADDFSELKKITALLEKAFNRRKFYSKTTNNNLRTSSTSQSANKKQEFVKTDNKKVEKKDDEKKRDMTIVKCYNCKKEGHFAKDCKKVKVKDYEYYNNSDEELNANMVFMAQIEKVLSDLEASSSSANEKISEVSYYLSESESESEFETLEYYDNSTNYGLFVNNDDDQEIFHDAIESASENLIEIHIDSQKVYDKSDVDHNDSEEKDHLVDKLIRKFNKKIVKCQKRIEKENQQSKDVENQNKDLQDKYDVLKNQATTFEMNNKELNEQLTELIEKNNDLLAQTKKQIADQEVLYDKMSVQLVELDKHVRDLKNTVLEKDFKISELEECQSNQTVHMIMPSKDKLYNGRKGIGFENPSYFEKAKDLRPTLYDEKLIDLGYVNEKINFEDDYFQEIINPDFEKIDSPFQQTSSLKPYVPNVILKKIIIDLEDEVVNRLEKEKVNLETIESLKSKSFESSENVISESENQSENDCLMVEKECDKEDNPKMISSGMFKLNLRPKHSGVVWKKKGSSNTSNIVQIYLWIIDSRCSKHMIRNRALLMNFVEKFLGTVCFGNNDFAVIGGCRDVVIRSMTIKKVYYVEGLGHNLFSVGQFCDKGLEVTFRKSTCFVRNEDGVDLLTGDRSSNLYTIALNEVASNYSTCLLGKASSSQYWLWHQRLSHLNFATINNLVKNNLVQGLPKMKFEKRSFVFRL
nr:integrase, catalytic region, zinc finger, CCHC-type, peptidase aspartic, catalytic [Tanacetum cinerariifolium]